ncbi:hypothetical protein [Nocardioides speluncae]|uniref:hypothetical protein n=1 Tax=Nocardioides speluncae TaxID=2670337 RepID=UPI000D6969C7|nr:hypothetical protein [Nocardioides speluncae]
MTDDSKKTDRILSAAEEEAVRRQLAAARHTGSMPTDVATRLDDVIAGLQAERAETERAETAAPNVVPLASRRRFRIAQGIVAAAAVVAVGVGVTQVLSNLSPGASHDDAGGDSAAVTSEGEANRDDSGESKEMPPAGSSSPNSELAGPRAEMYNAAPQISSESFQRDVALLDPEMRTATEDETGPADGLTALRMTRTCGPTSPPAGYEAVPVRYDGRPAMLVFGKVVDDRQRVDLYLCATGVRERSVTIQQP